jgi:hypothetical protein
MTQPYPKKYQYLTMPIASVPANPTSPPYEKIWFATWSATQPDITWSQDRPAASSDATSSWAVGVCVVEVVGTGKPPVGATVILESGKCVDPPPLKLSPKTTSMSDFQAELTVKLTQKLANLRSMP